MTQLEFVHTSRIYSAFKSIVQFVFGNKSLVTYSGPNSIIIFFIPQKRKLF